MTRYFRLAIAAAIALNVSAQAADVNAPMDSIDGPRLGGRIHLYGFAQQVDDSARNDMRLYLFLKQARLSVTGTSENLDYHVQMAYAGEDEVRAPNPGVSLNLLDYNVTVRRSEESTTALRLGQFKVPYGRESLTESGAMQFATRSIQHLGFRTGRDVGGALSVRSGDLSLIAGLFAGGGRDVPERFLPQTLGFPLVALRAGVDTGVDQDALALEQSATRPEKSAWALFVNGLFTRDSLVGHSTVLNVKTADKSLLINGNWNPFVGRRPLERGDLWMVGADAALRSPMGEDMTVTAEAEFNHAKYDNEYGAVSLTGGRAQVGARKAAAEVALRYVFLKPDAAFAYAGKPITGDDLIHEVTPAFTYHFAQGVASKLVLDMPFLLDVPVVTEDGVGAYVLTEQPDQTSIIEDSGTVARQTVIEARLLIQTGF